MNPASLVPSVIWAVAGAVNLGLGLTDAERLERAFNLSLSAFCFAIFLVALAYFVIKRVKP